MICTPKVRHFWRCISQGYIALASGYFYYQKNLLVCGLRISLVLHFAFYYCFGDVGQDKFAILIICLNGDFD